MKVNMELVSGVGQQEPVPAVKIPEPEAKAPKGKRKPKDGGTDKYDESGKSSKLKTFLLVMLMVGGFVLFVWNMYGFVNNMRLQNQGSATTNVVYDASDRLDAFMDTEGSATVEVTTEASTEEAEDSPGDTAAVPDDVAIPDSDVDVIDTAVYTSTKGETTTENSGNSSSVVYNSESEAVAALQKEVEEANNHAALVEQELKNAEDMLDSSLQREADLQSQLDGLKGN